MKKKKSPKLFAIPVRAIDVPKGLIAMLRRGEQIALELDIGEFLVRERESQSFERVQTEILDGISEHGRVPVLMRSAVK